MKKHFFRFLLLLGASQAAGQVPDTDIFLSNIYHEGDNYRFSQPVNLTRRRGYDNQPAFTADGTKFYFVSVNKDTTQSDIYLCDLLQHNVSRVTFTPTSEYSPMITPDESGISVVRVDPDSSQRFYIIPKSQPKVAVHVDHSDSIGYYAWTNDSVIAMFILEGKQNSLQLLNIRSGERERIAPSIGRCLKTDRERQFLYFTDKSDTGRIIIQRMDLRSRKITPIIDCLPGSEDFEVLDDGALLQGNTAKLFIAKPDQVHWTVAADFSETVNDFYRIVIDPTGKLLALVAYTGQKP